MNIYIDCEWNGYGGQLISVALVSENDDIFYRVLPIAEPIDPWVSENVIPVLYSSAGIKCSVESKQDLQKQLQHYLSQFDLINIIADWPEDLKWFCELLITGPGEMIRIPEFTMEYRNIESISTVPHNAVNDAYAIMQADKNALDT